MNEYYYINRLKKENKNINYLHYELDRRIYSYGNQQKLSYEKKIWKYFVYYSIIVQFLIYLYTHLVKRKKNLRKNDFIVMSSAYHGFNDILKNNLYKIIGTPWLPSFDKFQLSLINFLFICKFIIRLHTLNFNKLISKSFSKDIDKVKLIFTDFLIKNNISAIFLPQDVGFFEKMLIDLAKFHSIPTFIVLHAPSLRYGNALNDNRADFVCVFGPKFKECLINSGFIENKIIVVGHPKLSNRKLPNILKFSFEKILVITKPMPGQPLETQEILRGRPRDTNRLKDRGNLILYLLDIQLTLLKFQIKKVKLRPHPSESYQWYLKYIDTNFFEIDKSELNNSLDKSTLLIGPTSALFFDAIYSGVNYLIYEPLYDDGLDILNDPVGSPFDGSDEEIPVAKDTNELFELLNSHKSVNLKSIPKYIKSDFNFKEIENFLNINSK